MLAAASAPRILLRLAESYANETSETERDAARVEELLAEVKRLAGNDERTWREVAAVYEDLGNWPAAKEAWEKALEVNLRPRYTSLYSLARLLATCPDVELRDPGRVADLARKAVELNPNRKFSHLLESLFDRDDTNSDNVLDEQERTAASIRRYLSPETDLNGDGAIDLNEFQSDCNQRWFNYIDEDDDGKLQGDEVVTGVIFPSLFEGMDVNRDDAIALDEFERAVELYPYSWLGRAPRSRPTSGGVGGPGSVTPVEKFAEHDENDDGMVTKDEAGEDYWETIAPFDTDSNGAVDGEEFQAGLRE